MPTGQRIAEETKQEAVRRVEGGEDVERVAKELGFAVSSYDKMKQVYGGSKRKSGVKRKVAPKKTPAPAPSRNIAQEKLIKDMEEELAFWRSEHAAEYYRNRNG